MALDEFSRIRKWTSRSAKEQGDGLSIGIGDDAAVFGVASGMEVVACCDAMIETVHFLRRTMKPGDIGYKAMVSNLSDVAAMGGIPKFAMVTIGVSPSWTEEECELVYEGIYEAAEAYGVRIIGGDTVSTPDALHLSISVLGEVERGKAIRRSGALPGDVIFVTGHVGGSAAGLHVLLSAKEEAESDEAAFREWTELIQKHRRPVPRIQEGRLLLNSCKRAGALNDVSDGLASELWEIAEASKAALVIEESLIPIADVTRQYVMHTGRSAFDWALYGGEDYELVGTVAAEEAARIEQLFREHDCTFRVIGRVEAGEPGVWLTDAVDRKRPLPKGGYNHFSR